MRDFTDPFTGETLDDPKRKTYKVMYSVQGGPREQTYIDTLAKNSLTKSQAKQKLLGRATMQMMEASDITVHSVTKTDESY